MAILLIAFSLFYGLLSFFKLYYLCFLSGFFLASLFFLSGYPLMAAWTLAYKASQLATLLSFKHLSH